MKSDVIRTAALAMLSVPEEEKKRLQSDISEILRMSELFTEFDSVQETPEESAAVPLSALRPDRVTEERPAVVLPNERKDGLVRVKRTVG